MHRSFVLSTLLLLTACATGPAEPPIASSFAPGGSTPALPLVAPPSAQAAVAARSVSAEPAAAETIDINELDTGLVCEYEKRPGSRIAEKYCYTREERAATQAARDEQVRQQMNALALDQERRAAWERELARRRSPSGL